MSSSAQVDVKDLLHHIRTVQFSLTISCLALFGAGSLGETLDPISASAELRIVKESVAQRGASWPEYFLSPTDAPLDSLYN